MAALARSNICVDCSTNSHQPNQATLTTPFCSRATALSSTRRLCCRSTTTALQPRKADATDAFCMKRTARTSALFIRTAF